MVEMDIWAKAGCLKRARLDNPLCVNLGCGGIGDALLAACAVRGVAALHPKRLIVFKAGAKTLPFVDLFDMGNTLLAVHDWDGAAADLPPEAKPHDLQMNVGYELEKRTKSAATRLERYCRNVGGVTPELPKLKNRKRLLELGQNYRGCVALAPFGAWTDREYPVHAWQTVEAMLQERGHETVVLSATHPDFPDRHKAMKSDFLLDASAEQVAAVLLNAKCFIGNDSGLAHLSGIMGMPTVVLCGQVLGEKIYGFYPNVRCLQGVLNCGGCYWQEPNIAERCAVLCAALASITPERVVKAVEEMGTEEATEAAA